jgi:DNA topoisomerase-3
MLILCEKPSVAKDFAGVLGCEARKGCYQRNRAVITYAVGHLFRLCDPEAYNPAYKSWDAAFLPIIPSAFRYEKIAKSNTLGKAGGLFLGTAQSDSLLFVSSSYSFSLA